MTNSGSPLPRFGQPYVVVLALLALHATFVGCTTATPRFTPGVQAAVVDGDMQRLETEKLVVYYAKGQREEALRIASRLEYCRRELEQFTRVKDGPAADKSVFVIPVMEYNNAYIQSPLGMEQIGVLPTYATAHGLFMSLGIPPDPGSVGCHEMVHDTQARQVSGAAKFIRNVFGQYYSPQAGLDPWFWEGLAVYFETRLQSIGRLENPYFDGHFAAGIAGTTITGDDLNVNNRAYKYGPMYLVGSRFIDYLARTYGEEKLWELVAAKSSDIFFVIGVNNLFNRVYGKRLSAIIDDFAEDTKKHYPVRVRPAGQREIAHFEQSTEYFLARSGHSVVVKQGLDQQARITVHDPQGRELLSRFLNDIGVDRRLIAAGVDMLSGLSMTADGKHVYFVALDPGPRSGGGSSGIIYESRLVHIDVEADRLEVLLDDMHGSGGSVTPDGSRYYFSRGTGDYLGLHYVELPSLREHQLSRPPRRFYQAAPMASPDGKKLLVTEASDAFFTLAIYDAESGERLAPVAAPPGMVLQPSWVDDERVVYMGVEGRRTQVFETDLATGTYRALTDAPYAVSRPFSNGKVVRFLNREGWAWTLDEVDYPVVARAQARDRAVASAQSDEPTASDAGAPLEVSSDRNGAQASDASGGASTSPTPVAGDDFTFAAVRGARLPNDQDVTVVSEEPYSSLEGLFVPQLWGPYSTVRDEDNHALGLFVNGGDRLGFHRWAAYGAWDFTAKLPTVGVSYINSLAAPYLVTLDAAYIGRRERETEDIALNPNEPILIRETVGSLMLSREWYNSVAAGLGARYLGAVYERESTKADIEEHRFAGPSAALGISSFDSTPYGGTRRGFSLSGNGAYFPSSISSTNYDITDAKADLAIVLPLPLSRRHKLTLLGTGRGLLGMPEGENLLQLGGGGNATIPVAAFRGSQVDRLRGGGVLPPALRFFQPLRGFEDQAIFGRYAAVGEATYNYPFIFDWGTASALRFLPSVALRQIDLELFFAGASLIDKGRESAYSVGASIDVRVSIWLMPIAMRFQGARRLSYDEDFAFFFALLPGD